jgi:circadian clock protein KaiB
MFDPGSAGHVAEHYRFRLYVAGTSLNSVLAIRNIRRICRTALKGRCEFEVIDLYQQPELAARDRILVAPTLVKSYPLPRHVMVGDLSDVNQVLRAIGVRRPESGHAKGKEEK